MKTKERINDIPKAYDSSCEDKIYEAWEKSGTLSPEGMEEYLKKKGIESKKPFVSTLPPPNANGDLHLGHTCGYAFQDLLGRYFRTKGRPTLLLAGKDHAGIQTETVFVRKLKSEGVNKWDLGREEFYKRCYDFCIESAKNARQQEKRIGLSADWNREFFTLDPKLTKTVYETFFSMFSENLIYREKRIINFCPACRTALADVDTVHMEKSGIFAYILYPFLDEKDNDEAEKIFGKRGIVVATTRPETMLGDTAVAVNPSDERYKKFVGKKIRLPIVGREIPVIVEETVEKDLGTGALKVTPGHSPVDFEIGQKHGLEIVNVIDEKGFMMGEIPEKYIGMETVECSKELVKDLEEDGLLIRIDRIKHEVTACERCDTVVQPVAAYQWFVNTQDLARQGLEVLKQRKTVVLPPGQMQALKHFYENIQPWCISRQLWWGHRIPVWYSGSKGLHDWLLDNPGKTTGDFEKDTGKKAEGTGEAIPSVKKPKGKNGENFEQESDVLDTWFSSGQWPFSTLKNSGEGDFEKYYPTDVMVHGRDILFWWTGRMIMMGLYKTGVTPFETVFLTGMIQAPDGSKMSKSRNNTISPQEMVGKYGADSLRLWYYTDSLPGANAPLREEKIKGNRNFVNKIWNASRFVIMNIHEEELENISKEEVVDSKWIEETRIFEERISEYIENYKFHLGAEEIREFFWHTFCDKWIEEVKDRIKNKEINSQERIENLTLLIFILKKILVNIHSFAPFVTEAVWQELVKLNLADSMLIIQQR
jgi:valyl-tRNA synthetase